MTFIEEMRGRGLVAQLTHEQELTAHLSENVVTAYTGFDPTGESLHVGHLLPIITLRRWQNAGHRVIALIGGGTALIGDPTGKTEMRKMEGSETIDRRLTKLHRQLGRFLDLQDPHRGLIVNNADWLKGINYLDFLRDIGLHFNVNRMLGAECFRQRMEKGLSFLEFNYMILQGYDFLELYQRYGCSVQMGGDDQWSNMLSGMDLIRKKMQKQAYCMTVPLLVSPQGKKMGKTEKGAVWLDESLTSAYEFYQYFRNLPDEMIEKCLCYFTDLSLDTINEVMARSNINEGKSILAFEVTSFVHGKEKAEEAQITSQNLFGKSKILGGAHVPEFEVVLNDLTKDEQVAEISTVDLLDKSKIFPSKSEIRRLIRQGGLFIEDKKVENIDSMLVVETLKDQSPLLVRKGKKHYYYLRVL